MIAEFGKTKGRGSKLPFKNGVVGALDVGSTKIACLIVKAHGALDNGEPQLKVMGIGQQASTGVRGGNIVDIDAAENSIRAAVEQAEHMAGITLRDVLVSVTGGQLQSRTVQVEAAISGHEISEDDLARAYATGRAEIPAGEREVLHCMPGSFSVDGTRGIRNPIGMIGETLGVSMHVVTASSGALRNLEACVGRCHLRLSRKVAAPFAAGLATLVADEIDLGATVIDMGGGSTSLAVFFDGGLIFADVLPVGGNHVTSDIARGLSTSLAQAERLKTLYGSALSGPNDGRDFVDVARLGEGESDGEGQVPRSVLTGIIQPRIEETFEIVRDRLAEAGLGSISARRVVLTGGGSQMNGAKEIAARVLSRQIRLGRPARLIGLPDSSLGAAFSSCAGLATWAAQRPHEVKLQSEEVDTTAPAHVSGLELRGFAGVKRWLRENF